MTANSFQIGQNSIKLVHSESYRIETLTDIPQILEILFLLLYIETPESTHLYETWVMLFWDFNFLLPDIWLIIEGKSLNFQYIKFNTME